MQVTVNGKAFALEPPYTVEHLLEMLRLPAAQILIEHNGTALRRAEWKEIALRESDRIELLRIAAGG